MPKNNFMHIEFESNYSTLLYFTLCPGLTAVYHADNEYCLFTDMSQGYRVFSRIIDLLEEDWGQERAVKMLLTYLLHDMGN